MSEMDEASFDHKEVLDVVNAMAPPRIVCAALKHKRDDLGIIIGPRHFDETMRDQICARGGIQAWKGKCTQGFIDQFGRFHDRQEAWEIAVKEGQIWRKVSTPGKLYSENLY